MKSVEEFFLSILPIVDAVGQIVNLNVTELASFMICNYEFLCLANLQAWVYFLHINLSMG